MRKKYFVIPFLLTAIFFCGWNVTPKKMNANAPGVNSLEEMGQVIIEIFKKNDSNAYFNFFVNEKELTEVLNTSSFDAAERADVVKRMKEDPVKQNAYRTFREIEKDLKESDIDWNKFELLENEMALKQEYKMQTGSFKYTFKCNERTYSFGTRKMLKTSNGWKLTKNVNYKFQRKQEEEEIKMMIIRDSLLADSVMRADQMAAEQAALEMQRLIDSMIVAQRADSARIAEKLKKEKVEKKKKGK